MITRNRQPGHLQRRLLLSALLGCLTMVSGNATAREYVLIVGGLGGSTEYAEQFEQTASQIAAAYTSELSPSEVQGAAVAGDSVTGTLQTGVTLLTGDSASRESVLQALAVIAGRATADDVVILMLIGHGSYDGEHYKFNLPGSDLTGADLKSAVDAIESHQQLVVLATSASGVLLKTLESSGRILITATKTGGEINAVEFPRFWADAVSTGNADYDRNEIVTAQEAFRYTEIQVEAHYAEKQLLASEHPRIQGANSERFAVARTGYLRGAGNNPEVASLLEDRVKLVNEITGLRDAKASMTQTSYFDALEQLMLKMARLQIVIDRETGWTGSDG